jgi:ketosteroid isomerase-like protein
MLEPMDPKQRVLAEAAVLRANQSFYEAFGRGDYARMEELWARSAPVACLHPGAPLISGRAAVLDSWRRILEGVGTWSLVSREASVLLFGDVAVVTCLEANGHQPAHLIASNVFVLEERDWRLVHHQAGPLTQPVPARPAAKSSVN